MKRTMAVINKDGIIVPKEETLPELKNGEVLIKVHASLISPGTEMNAVRSRRENPGKEVEDLKFGYANAGEILEVKGEFNNLKQGMRVAAMGAGVALHANYCIVPVNLVVPIPDDVSYADAAFVTLIATSMQSIRRAVPQLGEYGAILGAGIVGNICAQLSQLSGARVAVWEGIDSRIEIGKKCGINNFINFKKQDVVKSTVDFSAPYGLDFSIFAFGGEATKAFLQIKECMKRSPDSHQMGRVILVGGCQVTVEGGAATGNLNILSSSRTGPGYHDTAYEYGADYPNALIQFTTQRNLKEAIKLISEKRLIVEPMITHQVSIDKTNDMADLLINTPQDAMGVVLKMEH